MDFLPQGFFADSRELLQKPEQTPGPLVYLQPWLPPDISRDWLIFSLIRAPCCGTPAPWGAKPFPQPSATAVLLITADLENRERSRSSWNLEITQALGFLLSYIRDLVHPAADWGLDIWTEWFNVMCQITSGEGLWICLTWAKICRHLEHNVEFASVMNEGVVTSVFFSVLFFLLRLWVHSWEFQQVLSIYSSDHLMLLMEMPTHLLVYLSLIYF